MPSIAQQDYIFIPILDGNEPIDEIPQDIQNRLVDLAFDGRALDVVFCDNSDSPLIGYIRPFAFKTNLDADSRTRSAKYIFRDVVNDQDSEVACTYREITNEPDAQEEH